MKTSLFFALFLVACQGRSELLEQGPKGDRGDRGIQGAQGLQGESGKLSRSHVVELVSEPVEVNGGSAASVSASCPDASDILLSGGCEFTGASAWGHPDGAGADHLDTPASFLCTGYNFDSTSSVTLTTWITCFEP